GILIFIKTATHPDYFSVYSIMLIITLAEEKRDAHRRADTAGAGKARLDAAGAGRQGADQAAGHFPSGKSDAATRVVRCPEAPRAGARGHGRLSDRDV